MKKLNCILLIDDDESTNFLHELVIKKAGVADEVISHQSGKSALDYLQTETEGKHPQPDLIFLDINMPGMNGWEFLTEYKKLEKQQQGKFVVVMLTTSLHPEDESKANQLPEITDFMNKPLTEDMLNKVLDKYFE